MRRYLNDSWYFRPDFCPEDLQNADLRAYERVRIPHTVKEIPFNYVNNQDYQMVSSYYTELDLSAYRGRLCFLTFEGCAHASQVYVNGALAAEHTNGYTAFTVPLQPDEAGKARVLVRLDSRESLDQPPFGHVIDYLTYGGIYRDTYLEVKHPSYIRDVFVKAGMDRGLTLEIDWQDPQPGQKARVQIAGLDETLDLQPSYRFENLPVELWDTDHPNLYPLTVQLLEDGAQLDTFRTRVGFRTVEADAAGIRLNGRPIRIRGLNRHQAYPYVGYAMPARAQKRDAHILKYRLGLNAVRTSHYPQSQDFIGECDAIGLLVFTEIPGWQHIGGAAWKDKAVENVRQMVLQYRNHPSIFMWGVRINESVDDHDFYLRTNQAARQLDDTRLIGGVRCFKHSELLEDVYTYNDFFHNGENAGVEPKHKVTRDKTHAYLVTEYNGHMFPTKMFDDEPHRTSHIKRHYRVLSDVAASADHAGSFGWCMADYNTHRDFGSGDQICYHGVLDMFRNPKPAAYVYASQSDREPVLGVNSTMDIGEHPGGYVRDILVMTNCDSVRVYKGSELVREFYPDAARYPGLAHPPVFIDDLIGNALEEKEHYAPKTARLIKKCLLAIQQHGLENLPLRAKLLMGYLMLCKGLTIADGTRLYETYIGAWGDATQSFRVEGVKDGKVVLTRQLESFRTLQFDIRSDTDTLIEGRSYDVASVTVEARSQAGGRLCYFQQALRVETEGPIECIGPRIITLQGGCGGFYLRSKGPGEGRVRVYYREELVGELHYTIQKEEETC